LVFHQTFAISEGWLLIHCYHLIQCVKLYDIIQLSGKDTTLGAAHYTRIVPHSLEADQRQSRVELSRELLKIPEQDQQYEFEHILTGDESWFFFEYFRHSCWAVNPDDAPKIPKQEIQSERCLMSIIWGSTGIKSLPSVPKDMEYNSAFLLNQLFRIWCNTSVGRVGGKRFEALWFIWTMHDRTPAEKVRQLLLQQKYIESLPQPIVQIYRRVTSAFLECSRNECRGHHAVRQMN
jgi:hypothetical protein